MYLKELTERGKERQRIFVCLFPPPDFQVLGVDVTKTEGQGLAPGKRTQSNPHALTFDQGNPLALAFWASVRGRRRNIHEPCHEPGTAPRNSGEGLQLV